MHRSPRNSVYLLTVDDQQRRLIWEVLRESEQDIALSYLHLHHSFASLDTHLNTCPS